MTTRRRGKHEKIVEKVVEEVTKEGFSEEEVKKKMEEILQDTDVDYPVYDWGVDDYDKQAYPKFPSKKELEEKKKEYWGGVRTVPTDSKPRKAEVFFNPTTYDGPRDGDYEEQTHIKMKNPFKAIIATILYSKEELFLVIQLAEHLKLNTECIDPYRFPIVDVILGTKEVYVSFDPEEGRVELVIIDRRRGDERKNNYRVVSLSEFFSIFDYPLKDFASSMFKDRKKNKVKEDVFVLNNKTYPVYLLEEVTETSFNDLITNLDYEIMMVRKNLPLQIINNG